MIKRTTELASRLMPRLAAAAAAAIASIVCLGGVVDLFASAAPAAHVAATKRLPDTAADTHHKSHAG